MFEKLRATLCTEACKCPYPKNGGSRAIECHSKTIECQEVYWDGVKGSHILRKRKI